MAASQIGYQILKRMDEVFQDAVGQQAMPDDSLELKWEILKRQMEAELDELTSVYGD